MKIIYEYTIVHRRVRTIKATIWLQGVNYIKLG